MYNTKFEPINQPSPAIASQVAFIFSIYHVLGLSKRKRFAMGKMPVRLPRVLHLPVTALYHFISYHLLSFILRHLIYPLPTRMSTLVPHFIFCKR